MSKKKPAVTPESAMAEAVGALTGVDALFSGDGPQLLRIPLDMIAVKAQIREQFEDEENTLEDLAASVKDRGVLTPILVRPMGDGYELIAGERRYRASKLAGLLDIPALVREMSDAEAEDAQLIENIHRKNLTQIEEASKIQRDLDKLGSVDAVLAKYNKSRPWLSKTLALLRLPEQAGRLVKENISADVEVINTVKTVEKIDPQAAKQLVDDLKNTRGKADARNKAQTVRDAIKPKPAKPVKKPQDGTRSGTVATAPDRSQQEPSAGAILDAGMTERLLAGAYEELFDLRRRPETVLAGFSADQAQICIETLRPVFDQGRKTENSAKAVMNGLRSGRFATDGYAAIKLAAFLRGTDAAGDSFSLADIFEVVAE